MKYNKSAFTLIEITIALLVLVIGLLGILALFPVGLDASGRAAHTTKATFLAQKHIEESKRLGYGYVVDIGPPAVQAAAPYQNFDYQLTESPVAGTTNLKQVDVEVFWPAGTTQQSIRLTTFVADYTP